MLLFAYREIGIGDWIFDEKHLLFRQLIGPKGDRVDNLHSVLKERFGFDHFKGAQEEVIRGLLNGQNALVIMPTGFGKSLCFQLPSQILPGLTLVVSPLIALMKDQVDAALKKGLKCCYINSSLSQQERENRYKKLSEKAYDLVYVTPERFRKKVFLEALRKNKVSLLAVDEAHCISQWGHDFRPDYTRVGEIREIMGNPTTIALTATATPEVQKDILKQLNLSEETAKIYIDGIERPNLHLSVENVVGKDEKIRASVALRAAHPGPAIFYFSLISTLEEFSNQFQRLGVDHITYHGQLPDKLRRRAQNEFIKGESPLILATPAFGLGIDKPNVRLIVHEELPGSIEAYYQEVGRAGRDGKDSTCVLLYDGDDISIQMDFIKWGNPSAEFIRQVFELIKRHPERVQAEGLDYIRGELNFYNRRDFRVETSVNLLERWECVRRRQKQSEGIEVLQDPPEEYLNSEARELRLQRANEKLLEMVKLAKQEGGYHETIYEYFGVNTK